MNKNIFNGAFYVLVTAFIVSAIIQTISLNKLSDKLNSYIEEKQSYSSINDDSLQDIESKYESLKEDFNRLNRGVRVMDAIFTRTLVISDSSALIQARKEFNEMNKKK